ncbi:SdrD B-like domain-containing protein [Kitasatospora sp. MMS16-BH015]|uniref:SdrD B-like domain-containing protein n=1 Tax=Kitasatospora sp. MMS16-BH015 TaxID=2018025 RepID=UPI000CF240F5|nr:SdrD B-like domain-containing protein [Kitasatospora sp. MMS16-BH015]
MSNTRKARARAQVGALVLLLSSAGALLVAPANAAAGDGTITVKVVHDFDSTGMNRSDKTGVAGMTITVTDDTNTKVTGTTDANGVATFNAAALGTLTTGKYRVEMLKPPAPWWYAPAYGPRKLPETTDIDPSGDQNGTPLATSVEFVNVSGGKNADLTMGVVNLDTDGNGKVQAATRLATPTYLAAWAGADGKMDPTKPALIDWNVNTFGNETSPNVLAKTPEVGALWGMEWNDSKKLYFSSAFLRRSTYYGPGGSGAIYATDPSSKQSFQIANVPNAGSTKHREPVAGDVQFPYYRDSMAVWNRTSKEAIGDIELSEDQKTLYAVNLNTKELNTIDVSGVPKGPFTGAPPAYTPASPSATVAIPNQCPTESDWRPWGLGEFNGKVYVGGVCTGESLNTSTRTTPPSDAANAALKAFVLRYDPATKQFEQAPVFTQSLDFKRPKAAFLVDSVVNRRWNPWLPDGNNQWYNAGGYSTYPQPILSDIEFDDTGNMILAFRDRFGDQVGYADYGPIDQGYGQARSAGGTAGDLRKVCLVNGTYVWDDGSNPACPGTVTKSPTGYQQGRDASTDSFFSTTGVTWHSMVPTGGLAFDKVTNRVVTTAIDPIDNTYTNGVRWFDYTTGKSGGGTTRESYQPFPSPDWWNKSFGKANGMGDLALMQTRTPGQEMPIQIGNRVWFDTNRDGIQQPSEPPLGKVHLVLYDKDDNPIEETWTDAQGQWNFWVKPNTKYRLEMTMSPEEGWTGLPAGVDQSTLVFTKQGSVVAWPPATRSAEGGDKHQAKSSIEFQTPATGGALTPEQFRSIVTKGIDGRG